MRCASSASIRSNITSARISPSERCGRRAAADKVDVTLKSFGGEKPLADGEAPRPITSGDVVNMFTRHRKAS